MRRGRIAGLRHMFSGNAGLDEPVFPGIAVVWGGETAAAFYRGGDKLCKSVHFVTFKLPLTSGGFANPPRRRQWR